MRPEAGWVVGVDVGRSWLRIALANLAGEVVLRRQERSQSRDAKKLVAQIGTLVSTLPVEAGLSYQDVTYTVIGSPGVVDERGAMRLAANLSGWNGSSVLDALGDRLGSSLPWRMTSTWRRSANRPTGWARESRISSSSL
jgi:predicted NBD/HSP70 family sugar kinase